MRFISFNPALKSFLRPASHETIQHSIFRILASPEHYARLQSSLRKYTVTKRRSNAALILILYIFYLVTTILKYLLRFPLLFFRHLCIAFCARSATSVSLKRYSLLGVRSNISWPVSSFRTLDSQLPSRLSAHSKFLLMVVAPTTTQRGSLTYKEYWCTYSSQEKTIYFLITAPHTTTHPKRKRRQNHHRWLDVARFRPLFFSFFFSRKFKLAISDSSVPFAQHGHW